MQIIGDEIAVGNGIHAVGRRAVEAERGCGEIPVDWEARACERGGTQRAFIEPLSRRLEAAPVAVEWPAAVAARIRSGSKPISAIIAAIARRDTTSKS